MERSVGAANVSTNVLGHFYKQILPILFTNRSGIQSKTETKWLGSLAGKAVPHIYRVILRASNPSPSLEDIMTERVRAEARARSGGGGGGGVPFLKDEVKDFCK